MQECYTQFDLAQAGLVTASAQTAVTAVEAGGRSSGSRIDLHVKI